MRIRAGTEQREQQATLHPSSHETSHLICKPPKKMDQLLQPRQHQQRGASHNVHLPPATCTLQPKVANMTASRTVKCSTGKGPERSHHNHQRTHRTASAAYMAAPAWECACVRGAKGIPVGALEHDPCNVLAPSRSVAPDTRQPKRSYTHCSNRIGNSLCCRGHTYKNHDCQEPCPQHAQLCSLACQGTTSHATH